jgi:predicted RNA-binding Zn ribbon-like protein
MGGNLLGMSEEPDVPRALRPVRDLINTWYGHLAGGGDDSMRSAADLAAFCRAHGVDTADDEPTDTDVEIARALREGLRAALAPHTDSVQPVDADALERLAAATAELPLQVAIAPDGPVLRAQAAAGPRRVLAELLAGAAVARADGTWPRLKVCREPRCRTAFYDTSRNNSGVWCSMAACGTEAKKRAYVERRRARTAAARAVQPEGATAS